MSLNVPCPTCHVSVNAHCVSRNGRPTDYHKARKDAARRDPRIVAPRVAYNVCDPYARLRAAMEPDVHADTWTPRKVDPVHAPMAGAPDFELEDAYRLIRNHDVGRTDDTIDPIQVVRDLVRYLDNIKSEWTSPDERATLANEVDDQALEIENLQKQVKELQEESSEWHVRADTAECERDQARLDLARVIRERDDREAQIDQWRSTSHHWERQAIEARNQRDVLTLASRNRSETVSALDATIASLDRTLATLDAALAGR